MMLTHSVSRRAADVSEIQRVFDGVVQCAKKNDAKGMRFLAGPGTWAWAESILDAARHADAARFATLGFYDQTTVLVLRVKYTAAKLAGLTPADILGDKMPLSDDNPVKLSEISIAGDSAAANVSMILPNGTAPLASGNLFTREDGHWKMEWHLISMQIMDRSGPKPSDPRTFYRSVMEQEYPGRWEDRLLDGPR